MKNKMSDLRNHLFETLEALKDEENPMDIKRAHAISHVARTIIESAKTEVQFLKETGAYGNGDFFGEGTVPDPPRLASGSGQRGVS